MQLGHTRAVATKSETIRSLAMPHKQDLHSFSNITAQ